MKVESPTCQERRNLSKTATEAIRRVFVAKADFDAAVKSKLDTTNLSRVLVEARKAESEAVDALHRHKNTHGC
jgi:hypothetical protein